jgi:hypothetical protein
MDSVIDRWFGRLSRPRSRRIAPLRRIHYYLRQIVRRAASWDDAEQIGNTLSAVSVSLISSCPFCAAKTTQLEEIEARNWSVVCGNCGSIGPLGPGRGDAIDLWNRRLTTAPVSRHGASGVTTSVTIDAPIAKIKFKTDTSDLFERFPHFHSIKAIWGSPECRTFLAGLLMDNRDGSRQGFDRAASTTIFSLLQEHDEKFPHFSENARGW